MDIPEHNTNTGIVYNCGHFSGEAPLLRRKRIALKALRASLNFAKRERTLLEANVNERSLTHKLAEHLQAVFPSWNVDCEYNRLGQMVKRLPRAEETTTDDTEGRSIFPDIIVHKRGANQNLLVIEAKKTTNQLTGDVEKLCGLTAQSGSYAYEIGLHLIIDCEQARIDEATAYINGAQNREITELLRRAIDLGQ